MVEESSGTGRDSRRASGLDEVITAGSVAVFFVGGNPDGEDLDFRKVHPGIVWIILYDLDEPGLCPDHSGSIEDRDIQAGGCCPIRI